MMGFFYTQRTACVKDSTIIALLKLPPAPTSIVCAAASLKARGPQLPLCALENVSPALPILAILASLSLFSSFLLPFYGKVKT